MHTGAITENKSGRAENIRRREKFVKAAPGRYNEYILDQVIKQLEKLQEIIEVVDLSDIPAVRRQLLLMKVSATHDTRLDIIQLANAFGARIVDIKSDSIIIEATAEDEVMSSIVETFEPYGIISLIKTGTVALRK